MRSVCHNIIGSQKYITIFVGGIILFYFISYSLIAENNIIGQRNALVQAHYRILLDFSNTKESGLVLLLKMTIGW
jgi:hypothetical protein